MFGLNISETLLFQAAWHDLVYFLIQEKERTDGNVRNQKYRSAASGNEFVQRLNELLKRYSPQQVDREAQGCAASERDNSRCLCEISISAATDCCAVTAGERPFATSNHLIQTLLLFHTQHG